MEGRGGNVSSASKKEEAGRESKEWENWKGRRAAKRKKAKEPGKSYTMAPSRLKGLPRFGICGNILDTQVSVSIA